MMTMCIAVIGGGFSGLMTAVNLIKKLPHNQNVSIVLIEKTDSIAKGVAYSTNDPYHFLNVRADRMGALSNKPDDFYLWVKANQNEWRSDFPELQISPSSFFPRKLYALYLASLFQQAKSEAEDKNIQLTCIKEEVLEVSLDNKEIKLVLANKQVLEAKVLVLAMGFSPFQNFKVDSRLSSDVYIENIWDPSLGKVLNPSKIVCMPSTTKIAIIGSGLTMVDVSISLIKNGYKGEIVAISKLGELPEAHLDERYQSSYIFDFEKAPNRLLQLIKHLRKELNKGIHWHVIVDSLRPFTVRLWKNFSLKEKKSFVRHLLSQWNKWRHRIPPESFKILEGKIKSGKLSVIKGKVESIQKTEHSTGVCIVLQNGTVEADYVLNCSGPQQDIRNTEGLLLQSLLKNEIISLDPLNKGLCVDDHYRVVGKQGSSYPIYAMGQLLYGQKLETTAVPELREQASLIAEEIISK